MHTYLQLLGDIETTDLETEQFFFLETRDITITITNRT